MSGRLIPAALGLAAAGAWAIPAAQACQGPQWEDYVLLTRPPAFLPRGAVVLEVDAEIRVNAARSLRSGTRVLPVVRTVRGDFNERRVAIAYDLTGSCDYFGPPGRSRYIVGLVERGADGQPVRDRRGYVLVAVIPYRNDLFRTPDQERETARFYDDPLPAPPLEPSPE